MSETTTTAQKVQEAQKNFVVVKIGGSSFSDKKRKKDYSSQVFPLIAREIPPETAAVIILGGGRKAHEYAEQNSLGIKRDNLQDALEGKQAEWATVSYIIDKQMAELRDCMRAEPYKHALMPLSASSHFRKLEGGAVVMVNFELIYSYLTSGFKVGLHGDGVPDSVRKRSILSGDNMLIEILNALPAGSRGIFCTDVPGVLRPGTLKPDVQPNKGDVIKHLRVEQLSGVKTKKSASATDVTGLMGGKLDSIKSLKRGRSVQIIGIRDLDGNPIEGELSAAIAGKKVGTLID